MKLSSEVRQYGDIHYDPDLQRLTRSCGESLKLRPQSLKVFLYLAENSDQVVSKEDVISAVWGNVFVTDDSLVQCVADIRRVLKDTQHKLLKTVPRKGYLFSPSQPQPASNQIDSQCFYGREQELIELEHMLKKADCRLLVILGFGGVGKSRLTSALQCRLQSSEMYQHGVVFVPLAPLQHSSLIPAAIARATGVSLQGMRSPEELLVESLQHRNTLLILDNIEHLLPDVEVCQAVLQQCPRLNIIITSRYPTQLEGEWVYRLDGLKLPDTADHIEQSGVGQLFINTASRINHRFKPNTQDLQHILEICQLLGGMPLGIEIAARWIQHLTCEEIVREMRLYLLSIQKRNYGQCDDTHALGNVLQQSWDMLTERERIIVQALALFRGDFTRQSATAIAGVELADYTGLIDKSMITRNSEGRYVLHQVMRRYATERRLMTSDQHTTHSRRFFDFHLEAARQADTEILGGKQLSNIHWLESEHTNFRECLTLCCPSNVKKTLEIEDGLELVGELGMFWFLANHWKEGRDWAVNFLNSNTRAVSSATHAKALLTAGGLSMLLDDYRIADQYLSHGTTLAAEGGSKILHARGLAASGVLRRLQGRLPEAIECGRHSMTLFESAGDEGGYQFNLGNLGHSLMVSELYDEAAVALERCISMNQRIGATISMPYALVNLGRLHCKLKQADTAQRYLQQAIQISEKLGILIYRAQALCALGWMQVYSDNYDDSLVLFKRGADDYLRLGDREGLVDTMEGVAVSKARSGDYASAQQFMMVASAMIEHWEVPVSKDHHWAVDDAMKRIKKKLMPAELVLYRNLGLSTSPEELFRAL